MEVLHEIWLRYGKGADVPHLVGPGGVFPIPPGFVVEEPAKITVRLLSTKGGKWAGWVFGDKAPKEALNEAPYEPILRAVVGEFTWGPPGSFRLPHENPPGAEVIQGGIGVINWKAKIIAPLPDPLGWLKLLEPPKKPQYQQGRLNIYIIEVPSTCPEALSAYYWGKWFFNHYICSPYSSVLFSWRVCGDEARGLVIPREHGYILSPDHPKQPIRIFHISDNYAYLLIHPFSPRD